MSDFPELPTDYDDVPPAPEKPFKFPSAEGWTGVPEDWKPTVKNPVPTFRCYFIKQDGTQCKKFALSGTGLNGTNPVCMIHGGRLPTVKAHADAVKDAVRMRLVDNADLALDTILDIMVAPGTPAQVRLKASTEILDRAGIRPGIDVAVEVEVRENPSEEIAKRLAGIAARLQPKEIEPEDLGEVVEEPEPDA